jgi:hypothetical protein
LSNSFTTDADEDAGEGTIDFEEGAAGLVGRLCNFGRFVALLPFSIEVSEEFPFGAGVSGTTSNSSAKSKMLFQHQLPLFLCCTLLM